MAYKYSQWDVHTHEWQYKNTKIENGIETKLSECSLCGMLSKSVQKIEN
jgi:hypothetical protein